MKLADHAGRFLANIAESDDRIVVVDGDLADSDGAIHFAERHPSRFLMAGIAEQSMISVAAGMASAGIKPWVFSFSAFLCFRAYDQIRVCLSQANQAVTLVGSHAGGLSGRNGKTHAALNDLALMLSLPNMHVWAPADFADVEFVIPSILQKSCPSYIRLPRKRFLSSELLPGTASRFRWIRSKQPVNIVSTGLATHWALAVAENLQSRGLDVGLLHCPQLKPYPPLGKELIDTQYLITIEDHSLFGGLATLVRHLCPSLPVLPFGWPEEFSGKSGSDEELLQAHGLSSDILAESLMSHLTGKSSTVSPRNVDVQHTAIGLSQF